MKDRVEESWIKIEEYISSTADFAIEQAPLVAQEIVMFGRIWNSLLFVTCLAAILVVVVGYILIIRYLHKHDWDGDELGAVSFVYWVCCSFILVPVFLNGIPAAKHATMAWFAPRLYIIEYIASKITG